MKNSGHSFGLLALVTTGLLVGAAPASSQSNEADLLRRTQMQLRQSEQERNSLRAEVARLQSQLDMQSGEIEKARQDVARKVEKPGPDARTLQALNASAAKLSHVTEELKQSQQELAEARAQIPRQQQAVQNMRTMLQEAEKTAVLREELIGLCRTRNQELYQVGHEILTMYRDKGFNSFAKREPVLQLQQVKLQNLAQEFEDRLRQQQFHQDTLPPSVEKAMQESLNKEKAVATEGAASPGT